jgi:hypothetical protein
VWSESQSEPGRRKGVRLGFAAPIGTLTDALAGAENLL